MFTLTHQFRTPDLQPAPTHILIRTQRIVTDENTTIVTDAVVRCPSGALNVHLPSDPDVLAIQLTATVAGRELPTIVIPPQPASAVVELESLLPPSGWPVEDELLPAGIELNVPGGIATWDAEGFLVHPITGAPYAGPQGPQGVPGERGSRWFVPSGSAMDYTDITGMIAGDIFLYPNSRDMFQYTGSSWAYIGALGT